MTEGRTEGRTEGAIEDRTAARTEDAIDRRPQLGSKAAYFKQALQEKLIEHKQYIMKHGDDMPAISGWKWGVKGAVAKPGTSTEGDNV